MRSLFFILAAAAVGFSCSKGNSNAGERVEIYLFASYETLAGKCQVDLSNSILQDMATIRNDDIIAYSRTEYKFILTEAAMQKVKIFGDGTAFAVMVDNELIYEGFFKPPTSSSTCFHSITMDIDRASGNGISLRLGYPWLADDVTIDDKRNDPRLIATLRKQGKLR